MFVDQSLSSGEPRFFIDSSNDGSSSSSSSTCSPCPDFALCYGGAEPPKYSDEAEADWNLMPGYVRAFGYVLAAIDCGVAFSLFLWTAFNRKSKVVRASQPLFLGLIALGSVVSGLTIIPLAVDDAEGPRATSTVAANTIANRACMASVWLYSLGFVLTFAPLFAKLWRVQKLFLNKKLRKVVVRNSDVLKIIAVLARPYISKTSL